MDAIFTRRSIRSFQAREVEPHKVEKLLKAAMQAPSAGNQQPWEFLVIQKRNTLKQLAGMSPYAGPIGRAALAIVVLGNTERMRFAENWQQDLGAATENILLEAVAQGLGGVWLGVHPASERVEAICTQFSLPQNCKPFAVVALGYPQEENANHFVDRYLPDRVHYESY